MKQFTNIMASLALSMSTMLSFQAQQAKAADVQVSFGFFHERLSPYGEWVEVANYGPAWHPRDAGSDWQPYQDGSWAYTDAGWTWVSNEPYGDTVYHYGRWVYVDDYGWAWVPGYEWAPAWVSWRASDDYVGWAPLPPEARWRPEVGVSVWADTAYDIGPRYYRFVSARDFCSHNVHHHIRPWHENTSLMGLTINITNINYDNGARRIFTGGPLLSYVESRSFDPVRRLRIEESPVYAPTYVDSNVYRYSRLPVAADVFTGRENVQRSIARTLPQDRVNHGWRGAGTEEQRRHLRSVVTNQVRGFTPDNTPARSAAAAVGGIAPDEVLRSKKDGAGARLPFDPKVLTKEKKRGDLTDSRDRKSLPPAASVAKPQPRLVVPEKVKPKDRSNIPEPFIPGEQMKRQPKVEDRPPSKPNVNHEDRPTPRKPDMPKPPIVKPEGKKPEAAKPKEFKPQAMKTQELKPQAKKVEGGKPEAAKPQEFKPQSKKPEGGKPQGGPAKRPSAEAAKPGGGKGGNPRDDDDKKKKGKK